METEEDTIWKNPSKSVVYSWMTDYIFQETWEEFCEEFSVDSETDRKLISGIVQKVANGKKSPEFILKTSLLIFMSLLSDAKDDLKDKDGDFEETILEKALTVLEKNLQVKQFEKELRQLARALRLQAVLCCCRRGEWTLAEEVSQRLWPEDSPGAEKKIVCHILSSKKEDKHLDRYMNYPAFLEKTKNLLAKVVAQFSVPFLQTICCRLTTLPNSQETDEHSEYHSAEEGNSPNPGQVELIDTDLSQENDLTRGHAGDLNNNQNNAMQESLMEALELQRQKKTVQPDKTGEETEEQSEQPDAGDDVDVEVSLIEIRERELRSRTVPGYVKQTMTLKAPKKLVVNTKEEENDETQIDNETGDGEGDHDAGDQVMEVPESEDEDGEQKEGNDGREKRKKKVGEMETEAVNNRSEEDDDDDEYISGIPPVSLTMLKHSFRKLGYGRPFWKGVEEELGSLHETLREPVDCQNEESPSPEKLEKESSDESDARRTSTPVKNNFQRPLTFPPLVPSKLGRMKQLQIRPTNSTNGIFLSSKNSSKSVDEAGPSGYSNGHTSSGKKRRKRLRDLESNKGEEDGVKVFWDSDDDSSEASIGSMISKASLKSPKLRRSLEGTSVDIRRPWTTDEVKRLIRGVKQFGVGKWSEIREHYEFERTNVNLKDKWRNLVRKYGTSNPHKIGAE